MSYSSEKVKKWRRKTKERIISSLGGKCAICDYDTCPDVFDVHHLDPSIKELSFAAVRANPRSWDKIAEELRNCVLLCCRCHREVHAGIAEVPDDAAIFDETFADYKATEAALRKEPCPICQTPKSIHMVTCSPACSAKKAHKADWATVDLVDLVSKGRSYESIGRDLGVTGASVKKRYLKLVR